MLDGWEKSTGVTAEIQFAKELNRKIYYATLEQIISGDMSFMLMCPIETGRLFCQYQKL
jgi:hypothetical protein